MLYEVTRFCLFRSEWVLPLLLPFRAHWFWTTFWKTASVLGAGVNLLGCDSREPPLLPQKNCWHNVDLLTQMALINSNTCLVKTHKWGESIRWNTNNQTLQPNHEADYQGTSKRDSLSLAICSFLSISVCLCVMKAGYKEITNEWKNCWHKENCFFFHPHSTVRAVDYEIVWSIPRPQ